ncbi:uncharacterized protein [Physcomitrium patens]|uniref:uncharacterized protein isoform X2 n=1 Tax=Physcomitrium patens TaxID=3218 RepID=UPI003CCDC327
MPMITAVDEWGGIDFCLLLLTLQYKIWEVCCRNFCKDRCEDQLLEASRCLNGVDESLRLANRCRNRPGELNASTQERWGDGDSVGEVGVFKIGGPREWRSDYCASTPFVPGDIYPPPGQGPLKNYL